MKTKMVHLPIDWTAFCRWVGNRGLMRSGAFDEGFALHVLLSSVFGKSVLQPYRVIKAARASKAILYAYSSEDQQALLKTAEEVAPPECLSVLGLTDLATKAMPERFQKGQRLGFDVRIRPVRRLGRDLRDSQSGRELRKGSELDAFRLELLHRSPEGWRDAESSAPEGVSRRSVYAKWLAERLVGAAIVEEDGCRLVDFRRSRAWRGKGKGFEGPDATLQGECVVADTEEFAKRIRLGVGRHRAYGFGMLIIRPPGLRAHHLRS